MFVREVGCGPAVLLLHGTPSPAEDWLPLADALGRDYRVLIPDLPGYGLSTDPPDASIEAVGDTLAAMLLDRGLGRVHAIVGYSTGAYRALDLATRAGIDARVIVSLAGVACFDAAAREARAALAARLAEHPAFLHGDEVRALMCELVVSPAWAAAHPGDLARVREWPRTTRPAALARELAALAGSRDLRPELAGLRCRVYCRVGTVDRGCPPAWSAEIARLAPRTTLELVFGCGHALLLEDGPATVAAIRRELAAEPV